jgi:hypothetical protein
MIDSGEVKNQTELALKLGTSKVHVCRVLGLLRLNTALIETVEKIGNPMPAWTVTVSMLHKCQSFPALYKALLNRLRNSKK